MYFTNHLTNLFHKFIEKSWNSFYSTRQNPKKIIDKGGSERIDLSDGNLRVVGSEESTSSSVSIDIYQGEKSREELPTVIFDTLEKILKEEGIRLDIASLRKSAGQEIHLTEKKIFDKNPQTKETELEIENVNNNSCKKKKKPNLSSLFWYYLSYLYFSLTSILLKTTTSKNKPHQICNFKFVYFLQG